MLKVFTLGSVLSGSAAFGFAPTHAPAGAQVRSSGVAMSAEPASRRALLASALFAVPAAASAMAVPGFNSPGLVKATKVPRNKDGFSGDAFAVIRDGETNHFWSPKGMVRGRACLPACCCSHTLTHCSLRAPALRRSTVCPR